MFTIIQLLTARANFIQFLRAENMFIASMETTGYKIVIDQSLTLYAIYKHSPSGYAVVRSPAYNILHTNLRSGQ